MLGQLTVFHNLSRLPGSLYAEINALQIQLNFVPSIGDTLFVQYLTDQTVDGRVVGSGCAFPTGVGPTPEGLLDVINGLDDRIDYLEQEEFFTRDPKNTVRAASTAAITLTYDPAGGLLGTGSITSAPASVDGVTLVDDDRVLLKNQTDLTENGIWRVVDAVAGDWVRAPDFDEDHKVTQGARAAVAEGSVNAESSWLVIDQDPLTIGTLGGSDINWRRLSSQLTVREQDGLPTISGVDTLTVPDGTLTNPAIGEAQLDFTSAALIRHETLIGTVDSVNAVFTSSQDFLPAKEVVYFDGIRVQEGCDYFRSESGGVGTGFDTITFVEAPRARVAPKANSIVAIQYVPA